MADPRNPAAECNLDRRLDNGDSRPAARRGGMHRESRPATVRTGGRNNLREPARLPVGRTAVGCRPRFCAPVYDGSCLIRGQLFVSGSPCRLECQLDWTAPGTVQPVLEIELSPGWITEQVRLRGSTDSLSWHAAALPSGSTRLQVAIPASALLGKELSLVYSASSIKPGARGPLELPRISLAGTRIEDDAWVAWADQATLIRPEAASGLAWIDPGQVPGLLPAREPFSNLREALGWRWISPTGRARLDREPIEQEPGASIVMSATVDPLEGHVRLDGRLSVFAGAEPIETIPIWIERPMGSPDALEFDDQGGRPVATLVEGPRRAALGLPESGYAMVLTVNIPSHTEKIIHFHAVYPWTPGSPVPLLAVSGKFLQRGTIVVKTPPAVRSRFKASRLRVLDRSAGSLQRLLPLALAESPGGEDHQSDSAKGAHAFAFNEAGARLELFTEPLEGLAEGGVVREALLATLIDPSGTALHRLRLLVHSGDARWLDLVLPPDVSLARVRRDGTDVAPIETPRGLSIPLAGASQGSRFCTVTLDYSARPLALEVRADAARAAGGFVSLSIAHMGAGCPQRV